ncbi:efflux RND transporter periplasmic adaptor subunit [Klebsiella pasteurii]|uniref:Efflux RND transporter periplasmic adaptor subunit n=1 Tax=Klebsiella pasteurii TaxID=2587529 RepID=A0ABT5CP06_9ENTR|nr:efflux RND transporter periplasmic adaptor subunit [Klebsiella pasteurii]MBG2718654.1 efflux RND transporter periplasmic adaptor subunit [Klebsiella michiganensis]MDC0693277.1 efflux RND transporter periplasmic adaptor subunit [Klebsiella pasteurii]MDC0754782.1 efflux RND transporter periplasmic adaptor subunit [Klebsiella pasteurii]MDQ2169747.1 efflux RND transporter periplasmic adaptor subunit [Klebsiella pasteurii]MDQ2201190.1 efflux RND transporter periplasmic adaptor subunit [Klebsiell
MKPKSAITLVALAIALAAASGYWLGSRNAPTSSADGAQTETGRKVLYWYDPMAPGTRFDKPGKSPFMDMDLVPRYADEGAGEEAGGVQISARQQQNLGVRMADVARRTLAQKLSAFGTVAIDERSVETVPALASGLIEKLYVNASQQFVKKNEALAELWIPQWAAAQQEYLAVRQLGDSGLTAAARGRLQLQFMPDAIIRSVERSGKPQTRITVRAPHDGYVSKLDVRTGAQVTATQPLFELASLDPVWIVIDYPQSQASLLRVGSQVTAATSSWPGTTFQGTVSELLPDLEATTRTLKARVVLNNPQHQLKPGMYLNVELAEAQQGREVLTIPEEALIATGTSNRVLIADGEGHFRPVEVTAGRTQDGLVEVTSGLEEGQKVVTSGQFLIDSEASLRSALPQMAGQNEEIQSYSAQGIIKAVSDEAVTIAHQPVPALKWPAMIMDFAITPQLREQVRPGESVMFHFVLTDEGARVTSIMPMSGAKEQP